MKNKTLDYKETKDYIKLFIRERENRYSIPKHTLDETIDRNIVDNSEPRLFFTHLSKWVIHLVDTRNINREFVAGLTELIIAQCPNNQIDWQNTLKAVDILKYYKDRSSVILNNLDEKLKKMDPSRSNERKRLYDKLIKEIIEKFQL